MRLTPRIRLPSHHPLFPPLPAPPGLPQPMRHPIPLPAEEAEQEEEQEKGKQKRSSGVSWTSKKARETSWCARTAFCRDSQQARTVICSQMHWAGYRASERERAGQVRESAPDIQGRAQTGWLVDMALFNSREIAHLISFARELDRACAGTAALHPPSPSSVIPARAVSPSILEVRAISYSWDRDTHGTIMLYTEHRRGMRGVLSAVLYAAA